MVDSIDVLIKKDNEFRESRLDSLFNDFSHLKEKNYDGYEYNIKVWKRLINKAFTLWKVILINYDEMLLKFKYDGRIPKGLYIVINEMINEGLINLEEEETSIWGKVKKAVLGVDVTKGTFVYVPVVKEISEKLKSLVIKEKEIINVKYLRKLGDKEGITLTDSEFKIVYEFMKKESDGVIFEDNVMYLGKKGMNGSELDEFANLNYCILEFNEQLEIREEKIKLQDKKIRDLINEKKMTRARVELRYKKMVEEQIKKILGNLDNLNTMKVTIENAKTTAKMGEIMGENGKLLKTLNEKNIDIDEVMDDIYKEIERSSEIGWVGKKEDDEEDDEIELELQKMIDEKEDSRVKEVENKLKDLTIAKKSSPEKSDEQEREHELVVNEDIEESNNKSERVPILE